MRAMLKILSLGLILNLLSWKAFALDTFTYGLTFTDDQGQPLALTRTVNSITVKLYDFPTGGSVPGYTETFSNREVKDGYIELKVGENGFPSSGLPDINVYRYVEISLKVEAFDQEVTLSPRTELPSIPLALNSRRSQFLGLYTADDLLQTIAAGDHPRYTDSEAANAAYSDPRILTIDTPRDIIAPVNIAQSSQLTIQASTSAITTTRIAVVDSQAQVQFEVDSKGNVKATSYWGSGAFLNHVVHTFGAQTIKGLKTFEDGVNVSGILSATMLSGEGLSITKVVHTEGNEIIRGEKDFRSPISLTSQLSLTGASSALWFPNTATQPTTRLAVVGGAGNLLWLNSQGKLWAQTVQAGELIGDGAQITNLIVTSQYLQPASVLESKLADNAVTSGKISDLTIMSSDIGTHQVQNSNIAQAAVTSGKISGPIAFSASLSVAQSISADPNNQMMGNMIPTHINLGRSSQTGMNGSSSAYISIAGGQWNTAYHSFDFIGGGQSNMTSGAFASILGGRWNRAWDMYSTVGGGRQNNAAGMYSSISGGSHNTAAGNYSSILGGWGLHLMGDRSTGFNASSTWYSSSMSQVALIMGAKMGLETTSPMGRLHIVGNGYHPLLVNTSPGSIGRVITVSSNGQIGIKTSDIDPNADLQIKGTLVVDRITLGGVSRNVFSPTSGAFTNQGLYAAYDSSVGIGITTASTPNATLLVNGSIARDIGVTLTGISTTMVSLGVGGSMGTTTYNPMHITVSGGLDNEARDSYVVIAGGANNTAWQTGATVSGGFDNWVNGMYSLISGGRSNLVSGNYGSIGGGLWNTAVGNYVVLGGGNQNEVMGNYASVLSGGYSTANTTGAVVGGGFRNMADGMYASVFAGKWNTAAGEYSFVGAGENNYAVTTFSTVVGGSTNRAQGNYSFVGGGRNNRAAGNYSSVLGGLINEAGGHYSSVAGGFNMTMEGDRSFGFNGSTTNQTVTVSSVAIFAGVSMGIRTTNPMVELHVNGNIMARDLLGSGNLTLSGSLSRDTSNILTGLLSDTHVNLGAQSTTGRTDSNIRFASIAGGYGNTAAGDFSLVGAGEGNVAWATGSVTVGGRWNESRANYSSILGGLNNEAWNLYSSIIGGQYNTAQADFAFIGSGANNRITSGYGTILNGSGNQLTGNFAFIGNGLNNLVQDQYAFVGSASNAQIQKPYGVIVGGANNQTNREYAVVVGGAGNSAMATHTFIGSGSNNQILDRASNRYTAILAGQDQVADSPYSSISGGQSNVVSATHSAILGGRDNWTRGMYSSVGTGRWNTAAGDYSFLGAGTWNWSPGDYSFLGSGSRNIVSGNYSANSAGQYNLVTGNYSSVGAGWANTVVGDYSAISAGGSNWVSGNYSSIGSGRYNTAVGNYNFIGSGWGNWTNGIYSVVSGGFQNQATSNYSAIAGGWGNHAHYNYSFIGGGQQSRITSGWASVVGGKFNTAEAQYSSIGGGSSNWATGTYSHIGGGWDNFSGGNYSAIGGGGVNDATGMYSSIAGGRNNEAAGNYSAVLGGLNNFAQGHYSAILGGKNMTITTAYSFGLNGHESNSYTVSRTKVFSVMGVHTGIRTTDPGAWLHVVGSDSTPAFVVETWNSMVPAIYTSSNGWIGLHTTMPMRALHVNGSIEADNFYGNATNLVFNSIQSFTSVSAAAHVTAQGSFSSDVDNRLIGTNWGTHVNFGEDAVTGEDGFNRSWISVVGGRYSTARADYSHVAGGMRNLASGDYSSVVGGNWNTASANQSGVFAGNGNLASGQYAAVLGGRANTAGAQEAAIVGGTGHSITGANSTILGGNTNSITNNRSTVLGGQNNVINGNNSVVLGGQDLTISGNNSIGFNAGGGAKSITNNAIVAFVGSVKVGINQVAPSEALEVNGNVQATRYYGDGTTLSFPGTMSAFTSLSMTGDIAIGGNLTVDGSISASNTNNQYGSNRATHVNLGQNSSTGQNGLVKSYASVGGGFENTAEADFSVIAGGDGNFIEDTATGGSILGGSENSLNGLYSTIGGGRRLVLNSDGSFGFNGGNTTATVTVNNVAVFKSVKMGIDTTNPQSTLHVASGGLCVGNDTQCNSSDSNGTIYAVNTTISGVDYAEYFPAEEPVEKGDLVGLNIVTGKARPYQAGDFLLGVASTKPGITGGRERDPKTHALVGLMGQVPFRRSQVQLADGKVFTHDGVLVGYLLSTGDVYVNRASSYEREELFSRIKLLEARLRAMDLKFKVLEKKLEKVIKD